MFNPELVYVVRGRTYHERRVPKRHAFEYSYNGLFFNLLSDAASEWVERMNRYKLLSICSSDYFFSKKESIRDQLKEFILTRCRSDVIFDQVYFFTTPRVLGFVFNPVNFYFGFFKSEQTFFLAEVNNTYRERFVYFEKVSREGRADFFKRLFVSPFFNTEGVYKIFYKLTSDSLYVGVDYRVNGQSYLFANFKGEIQPCETLRSLIWFFLKNPLSFYSTLPRIYWQGLKLWLFKMLPVRKRKTPEDEGLVWAEPYSLITQHCRNKILKALERCRKGRLVLKEPAGRELVFGGDEDGFTATVKVKDFDFYRKVFFGGNVGFGDSFVDEIWDSSNPAAVVGFLLHNWSDIENIKGSWGLRILSWLSHLARSNFRKIARKNIAFHYDQPVDFFKLFLDKRLVYSCAHFDPNAASDDDLESAQLRKIDSIFEEIELKSSDHLIDVGCGFGGLAIRAVERYGCKVTAVTISRTQFEYVKSLIKSRGMEKYIELRFVDYRDIDGKFDKVVSVEMIEAVGHSFLQKFLKKLDSILKPGGYISLQAICYPDFDYYRYLRRADWIQMRIFPGSFLPSLEVIHRCLVKTSLIIDMCYDKAFDYAKTLRIWRENLIARQKEALEFVNPAQLRSWIFYFASCEAEFATQWLRLLRLRLKRPNERFFVLN